MKKIIISGGPHSGKTNLWRELKKEFSDFSYVPEPAAKVINSEKIKVKNNSNYKGKFPWNNYEEFGSLVTHKSLNLESKINPNSKIVFLDRSLIDTIGYARLENCEFLIPYVQNFIDSANYDAVLFCDIVNGYKQTEIRHEDLGKAKRTEQFLYNAYFESGLSMFNIPEFSKNKKENLSQRVDFVKKILEENFL